MRLHWSRVELRNREQPRGAKEDKEDPVVKYTGEARTLASLQLGNHSTV